jgi:phage RecT family recombinase
MTAVQPRAPQGGTNDRDRLVAQGTAIMKAAEERQNELGALVPRGYESTYFIASLRLYLNARRDILGCTPQSIAQALVRVAQTGLELGVSCDILPFGDRGRNIATFNARTNGLTELMLKAGVRSVNAKAVREGDTFKFELGTPSWVRHVTADRGRGAITHAWCSVETRQGSFQIVVMNREEIDALRKAYSKSWWQKDGNVIPLEDIEWYAVKTVIRQAAKYAPKNPKLAAAMQWDAQALDELETGSEVLPPVDSTPLPPGAMAGEGAAAAAGEDDGELPF